jgi:hypothetical protein
MNLQVELQQTNNVASQGLRFSSMDRRRQMPDLLKRESISDVSPVSLRTEPPADRLPPCSIL